jgi:hypothetical protein
MGHKGFPQWLYDPHRLDDQSMKLGERWAGAVGLIVFLIPDAMDGDPACLRQTAELPMHGAGAALGQADQLCALEPPLGLGEQQCEHTLLHAGKQRIGQADGGALNVPSHIGNDHPDLGT